ncbi:MAG: phosphocholine cytidylyltransferase family protein [Thalassobaculum sp.]|uniref:phosphocholine cytidylyltransferase family protein n=1 Tax=Thalassobaculum sp. TaxID=2022740 RepID=UPI0032EAF612
MSSPYRALILAAGRGSRMRDATADRPKCLVPLAGRPLLDWQRSAFQRAGVDTIAAVGGYRAERLAREIEVPFVNPRWETTNMVRSLTFAAPWLGERDSLISYSDIAFRPSAVERLAAAPGDIAITYDRQWAALWRGRFEAPLEDAETFRVEGGRVVEIGDRPNSMYEVEGQFMGLLKFTVAGWQAVSGYLDGLGDAATDRLDMTGLLRRLIADGHEVRGVPVEGGWVEVDSESDLAYYESMVGAAAHSGPWAHDWR